MKWLFCLVFLSTALLVNAQNVVDWDGEYQLQFSDFRSPATQIGDVTVFGLYSTAGIDFSYQMTNAEYMLTKNFNSKVGCIFKRNAASLIAPDTATASCMLNYARYQFDLAELYARKLRKKIFEEKGAFTSPAFFQVLFNANQDEWIQRDAMASKETDLGRNEEKLKALHAQVLADIAELSDFCKTCKPAKKKK